MIKAEVEITNSMGIHMRPAKVLCQKALEFHSVITLRCGTKAVDAKSVLGVLSAGVKANDIVEIQCEGDDEDKALKSIVELINKGLGE